LGVQTSFDNLRLRHERFACIAHLDDPSHFVNVADVSKAGLVRLIDPPRSYEIPADTLGIRWKGTALLLSPDPLTPEEELDARWRPAILWSVAAIALLAAVGFEVTRRRSGHA
jgi:hypothetical protein